MIFENISNEPLAFQPLYLSQVSVYKTFTMFTLYLDLRLISKHVFLERQIILSLNHQRHLS